jgi:hypothetical protein
VTIDLGGLVSMVGQVLVVVALVAALIGALATLPRLLRVRRRARALSARLETARLELEEGLVLLAERSAETDELLRPLLRLRRWAGHPLSIALFQSYRRRRRQPS